jgi:hypothetical protein
MRSSARKRSAGCRNGAALVIAENGKPIIARLSRYIER